MSRMRVNSALICVPFPIPMRGNEGLVLKRLPRRGTVPDPHEG